MCFLFLWRVKTDDWAKFFWQMSHEYGLSPAWVLLCFAKSNKSENFFGHKSQWNGFSPVWIRLWRSKWCELANCFEHKSHEYGFSPEWSLFMPWKITFQSTQITSVRFLFQMNFIENIQLSWVWKCFITRFVFTNGRIEF